MCVKLGFKYRGQQVSEIGWGDAGETVIGGTNCPDGGGVGCDRLSPH